MLNVRGLDELQAALEAMAARIQVATPRAVEAGADIVKSATRAKLELKSHARGTPTPSLKGEPPARISGRLRDSVTHSQPVQAGPGRWMTTIGATTVYARIQELGGYAGRHHASYLPPRPYLRPAAEETIRNPAFVKAFVMLWAEAIKS